MRLPTAVGLGLLLTACTVGTHAKNYGPAKGPAGAIVNLQLTDRTRITGELLAVEQTALLILRDSQLVRIELSRVRAGSAPKLSFEGKLEGDTRERLRLVSRYPQGVSPELEGQLRRAYGEREVGAVDSFAARVRASTARYQDQGEALKDGYRRIGPDFPSMGEHWLNRTIVMRGIVDPLRPPILEYITVDGRPFLAGVAYAQLAYGDAPATTIPAPSSAWHYHAGSVDEESFIASHAAGGADDRTHGPSIAVLHAWLWTDNPAGLFATDNWMLPWLRLGATPPEGNVLPDSATLMAALAGGGERYFITLLRVRNELDAAASERVADILQTYADRLRAGPRTPTGLGGAWPALQSELRAICPGCTLGVHSR